ncbi:hypothetical protein BJV82DRAFT_628160 [Fennellomyces sp. T-0311]|nr:hypothetical protein BJV82DRAFT_628160 [Fennellomyces sp. T-0311]
MLSANQSSPFPTLITAHDAVTDSPIYRANVVHWDEQLDLFDKWLATLSSQFKQYLEKLNRFKSDTAAIYEKVKPPENMDDSLIASSLTNPAFNRLSLALQSTIACQTKMVLDIQTTYIEPLHQLSRSYLKDFKEFRKQHDKALDRYESQLQKYAALGKSKDPVLLRDEAELLHDARKEYVQLSGQHTVRVVNFRGLLANLLVDRISSSSTPQNTFEDLAQIWNHINTAIAGWRQWLIDDQQTCIYELRKMQLVRERLESDYIKLTEPRKELSYYTPSSSPLAINGHISNKTKASPACKWGYLFFRISRHTWARRWCFVYNEYFGWCTVSSKPGRAMVTVEEKISMAMCEVKFITEGERRFCFEIKHPQGTYIMQAEREEELRDWMACLNWIRRPDDDPSSNRDDSSIVDSIQQPSVSSESSPTSSLGRSPSRMSAKAKSTTTVTTPKDIPVTLSSAPLRSYMQDTTNFYNVSGLIFSCSPTSLSESGSPSAVAYVSNSLSNCGASLMTCLSLSPVLVWEAARSRSIQSVQVPDSLWGVPWPISGTMLIADGRMSSVQPGSNVPTDKAGVLWPLARESTASLNVDIANYELQDDNEMVRKMFGGVKPDEVVLDMFVGVIRRKQEPLQSADVSDTVSMDSFDKELFSQLATLKGTPPSEFGYGYGGKAFVTQHTLWFYSFTMLSCINTVAVKLESIENVRVLKDPSTKHEKSLVLVIDVSRTSSEAVNGPLIFSIPNEDINVVAEKLRFAINNAKSDEPMQVRNLYAKIVHMAQSQRNRSTSLLQVEQLAATPEIKKKRKRLSFRALGPNRPSISSKKPIEPPVLSDENKLTVSPNERGDNTNNADGILVPTETEKVVVAAPPPPPPEPVDPDQLPSHIKAPDGPVSCNCDDHLDKLETEIEFPISAKRLYDIMFSDEANASPSDGGVWAGKTAGTEGHDLRVSCWYNADSQTKRTLKYIMPVSNPIVRMKEAEVVETQVLMNKDDYICYVVQISTRTAALPYADAFIPSVRYCITWIDQSKCKLAIHLGVAWVQRVLVRAIVTRAAMKGMGDSIAVFIPVLEDAVNAEAERVEAERNAQQQQRNNTPTVVENLAVTTKPVETVTERQEESNSSSNEDNRPNEIVAQRSQASSRIMTSILQPPVKSVIAAQQLHFHDTKVTTDNKRTTQQQQTTVEQSNVHLKPPAPTHVRRPSNRRTGSLGSRRSRRASADRSRPSKRRVVPIRVLLLVVAIGWALFGLWKGCLWIGAFGNGPIPDCKPVVAITNETIPTPAVLDRKAVYLRDIEERGILYSNLQPPYADSASFQSFLKQTAGQNSLQGYRWSSDRYRQAAFDLDTNRDRLAILRHDLLMIFRLLNKVDTDLRESQYMNWLLDSRARCHTNKLDQDQQEHLSCQEVVYQLDTYFFYGKRHVNA